MIKSATVTELKQWMDRGEAVVIDVREDHEWAQGHIDGAVHVPLGQFPATPLPPHDGRRLVIQCKSGGRSLVACGLAVQAQPDLDAYNLEGGIVAWAAAGYKAKSGN